jgi:hypothetical protein
MRRVRLLVTGLASLASWTCLGGCSTGPIDVIELDPSGLISGLVAHWTFDDGAGTVLTDRSINQRNGDIINGSWISGQIDGALRFTVGEVSVPSFPQPTSNWSVAGWVRPRDGDFGDTYLSLISTELLMIGGWQMNVRLTVPTADAPVGRFYQFAYWIGPELGDYFFFNCECVDIEKWTHLAAVVDVDGGKLSFYRNGALVGSKRDPTMATLPKIKPGSPTLYLARWPPNSDRDLTGDLDDFVVYDRALAPREVELLARVGVPKPY